MMSNKPLIIAVFALEATWKRPVTSFSAQVRSVTTCGSRLRRANYAVIAVSVCERDQQFNPVALQRALAQDGIPALVRINTVCSSDPEPSDTGAISIQLPNGSPVPIPRPGAAATPVPHDAVMVINPAKIAAGTELTFNYLDDKHELHFGVISTGSDTCGGG